MNSISSKKLMPKLKHKRPECIGCYLCAETASSYFYMDDEGLAQIHDFKQEGVFQVTEAFEMDRPELEEAVRACPVNIISLN
jgi:ferredoxin